MLPFFLFPFWEYLPFEWFVEDNRHIFGLEPVSQTQGDHRLGGQVLFNEDMI